MAKETFKPNFTVDDLRRKLYESLDQRMGITKPAESTDALQRLRNSLTTFQPVKGVPRIGGRQ